MKISYAWLGTYFDAKLPAPDVLADLFNLHFAEIEGIEKITLSDFQDTVLDIKTLADRNHYALSHKGVAGEASAVTKIPLKASVEPKNSVEGAVRSVAVKVENPKLCPRYTARRINSIHVGQSPQWLRSRLEAIGARSINTIVDATNFVMFDMGQPLHAFDADKVSGTITVRLAHAGEKITLLDGREVELKDTDLVIADDEGPLVIAGVKGGKRAEVTSQTKSIILEAANFDPVTVRRTSTRLNIRNDSSKRFENEITPHITVSALERVTALIADLSKGAEIGEISDVYSHPVALWVIRADVSHMNAITGLNLTSGDMADILKRLQCSVSVEESKGKETLVVTPPLERLDLVIPEDIADEIVRMYGYENLVSRETASVPQTPIDKTFYWAEKFKNALVHMGFVETLLYTLVPKGAFEIAYPLASDKSALRERITPKLSESLGMNARNSDLLGLETIKIFEIGKVFPKTGEKTSLCMGVSQVKKRKGVTSDSILKETIASLETELGVKISGNIEVGLSGALVEVDFDDLVKNLTQGALKDLAFKALPADKKYVAFSPYPYIVRDIALFVPSGTDDMEVLRTIKDSLKEVAGDLLVRGPHQFDRFEKDGKVSYAFRMIFQSFEKTLSDDEVNGYMLQVYSVVQGKGWVVR